MKAELVDLSVIKKAGDYCGFYNCIVKLSKKDMEKVDSLVKQKECFSEVL